MPCDCDVALLSAAADLLLSDAALPLNGAALLLNGAALLSEANLIGEVAFWPLRLYSFTLYVL